MRILSVIAAATLASVAVPASATITFSTDQQAVQGENVLFQTENGTGTTVTGITNLSGTEVFFRTLTGQTLVTPASGQARVEASGDFLNSLEIGLVDPALTFDFIEFNLFGGGNPGNVTSVTLLALDQLGNSFERTFTSADVNFNGENFFVALTDSAQSITSVSFTSEGGFIDARQIRVGVANVTPPIPEPGTWAMMLIGFAAAGYAIRRGRRSGLAHQFG